MLKMTKIIATMCKINYENYENDSINELETVETEILIALKRLEKINSNFDVKKEKEN